MAKPGDGKLFSIVVVSSITNMKMERKILTNLPVENLFFSVANWFNDLEERLEESKVTQSPGLIIELLPLCFL